jgi:hypothetical protein
MSRYAHVQYIIII